MKIGVFVSETWGPPSTVAQVRERAADAERRGLHSVWVPYLPWSVDALAAAQAAAGATARIEVGTAVVPTYLYHPLALARASQTVFDASDGRFTLGVGPSQPAVIEAMHGIAYTRPALHTREYLQVLRAAQRAEGRVDFSGEIFQLASMFGVPSVAEAPTQQILVGALGERMLAAAGALAEGTIGTSCDEGAIERVIGPGVRHAAGAAGRPAPRVATVLAVCVAGRDTLAEAREAMYAHFATYERIPRYLRMLRLGDKTRMGDVHVCGEEAEVRRRLRAFADAGLTDLIAAPFMYGPDGPGSRLPTLDLLSDVAQRGL